MPAIGEMPPRPETLRPARLADEVADERLVGRRPESRRGRGRRSSADGESRLRAPRRPRVCLDRVHELTSRERAGGDEPGLGDPSLDVADRGAQGGCRRAPCDRAARRERSCRPHPPVATTRSARGRASLSARSAPPFVTGVPAICERAPSATKSGFERGVEEGDPPRWLVRSSPGGRCRRRS